MLAIQILFEDVKFNYIASGRNQNLKDLKKNSLIF